MQTAGISKTSRISAVLVNRGPHCGLYHERSQCNATLAEVAIYTKGGLAGMEKESRVETLEVQ